MAGFAGALVSVLYMGRVQHAQPVGERRHRLDYRGAARAQLMSASSSPGRTWSLVAAECRLSFLVGALAAPLRRACGVGARLPDVACVAPPVHPPHASSDGRLRREPHRQCRGADALGLARISLSLTVSEMTRTRQLLVGALLGSSLGCASDPVVPARDAGVNRVFATVRGVT